MSERNHMKHDKGSGIYCITNTVNGKKYYGSTVGLRKRYQEHLSSLLVNTHHNRHLQRAWNKYGQHSFTFTTVAYCCPEQLLYYEQQYIDANVNGYNICKIAGSSLGRIMSDETRRKLSEAAKNISDETRRKKSEAAKNISDETRRKMSDANKGKKHSDETRRKLSEAAKNISDETRRKMSDAQKRRTFSDEHRRKLSEAHKNISDETRRKLSEAAKKRYAKQTQAA